MILLTLTSGGTTVRLCNKTEKSKGGYDNGSYFFAPEITQMGDVDFEGMPFVSVRTGNITCEYKEVANLTAEEVTATLQIWDEYEDTSFITVFEGKALRTDITVEEDEKFRESVFVTYRLRTDLDELETDLLSSAYDLKQVNTDATTYSDGRILPMNFGYVKYAAGFLLAVTCSTGCGGVYSSDGKTLKVYDGGLEGNYTQATSATEIVYNPTSGRAPIYGLTQDIEAGNTASASVTGNADVIPVQAALTVANTALKTNQGGTDYIAYSVDSDGLVSFSVDSSGNMKSAGVTQHINGSATTATRLVIHGAYISSQTSVDSTHRTSYAITKDGQSHWYVFNTTTNLWVDIINLGLNTTSTYDNYLAITPMDAKIALFIEQQYDSHGVVCISSPSTAPSPLYAFYAVTQGASKAGYYATGSGYGAILSTNGAYAPLQLVGLTYAPSSTPTQGDIYFNSTDKHFYGYNGTTWKQLDNA